MMTWASAFVWAAAAASSGAWAAVLHPPDPNKLRVAVFDWEGIDGTSDVWDGDGSKGVTVSFLVGAKLFNDRRVDVIPDLAKVQSCNKQLWVTKVCDESGSPLRSAHDSTWVINEIGADAFAGFGGLEASFVGSMLGRINGIPTIDHWTSAPRTAQRRDFPWYARTIPSDETSAIMLASVVDQLGFKKIAVFHLIDGDDFATFFYSQLKSRGIEATLVQFKYGVTDNNIHERLAYVKSLSLNVIVCAMWAGQIVDIATAAQAHDLVGEEMAWIFTYMSRAPNAAELANANVTALFHGSLWVHSSPDVNPNLDKFLDSWPSFDADVATFNANLPPYGTKDSLDQCENLKLNSTLDWGYFSSSRNRIAFTIPGYAVDIMLAYGFAICHNTNNADPVPTGQALWDRIMNVSFVGVSGSYVEFDDANGDRSPPSAGFVLTNWNYSDERVVATFDPVTNQFAIPEASIVFKGGVGMQNVPKDVTAPYHEQNFLPTWAKGLGYAELAVINLITVFVAVFLVTKSNERVVVNGQPALLHLINAGCFIAGWSILTLALSDDDPVSSPAGVDPDTACMASPVLFTCGMSLTVTALNAKTYRVWRIFENSKMKRIRTSLTHTVQVVFLIQLILWAVCAAWVGTAPLVYERTFKYYDANGYPVESSGACAASTASGGFLVFVFFAFVMGLFVSAYAAYRVRTIPSDYQESRWVLLALMSMAQLYSVAIPTVVATYGFVLGRYIILTSVVFVSICVLHFCVFLPKVYAAFTGRELWSPDSATTTLVDKTVRVGPTSPMRDSHRVKLGTATLAEINAGGGAAEVSPQQSVAAGARASVDG